MEQLTDQQELFVQEYVKEPVAKTACLAAGYKNENYGRQLLQKDHVRKAIKERRKQLSDRLMVDAEMVIEGLLKEARLSDEEGGHTSARITAWSKLGKTLGMFVDKKESENTTKIVVEVVDEDQI